MSGSPARSADFLAGDLVLDGALDRAERVHVLDLDPRPEGLAAGRSQRYVGLYPHLAALHGGVRGTDGQQQQAQLLGIASCGLGIVDDRVGDDLHERGAGAVVVEEADATTIDPGVLQARGVLLEMGTRDPHLEAAAGGLHHEAPVGRERQLVLADLVALGQVRVEVVLAVPARHLGRGRLDGHAGGQHVSHGLTVDHRQRAGQPQADWAGVGVGGGVADVIGAAAEHLRRGPQLHVDLDADDGLEDHLGRGCRQAHQRLEMKRSMRTRASSRSS